MEIIGLSDVDHQPTILAGSTESNTMALGEMILSDGSHESMIDNKACRDQVEHTEEVETEDVELECVEEE